MTMQQFFASAPAAVGRAVITALMMSGVTQAAFAQDPEAAAKAIEAARTAKTSTIDAGAGYVSDDSFKAGEYNGLQSKGAFLVANFDLGTRHPYDGPGKVSSRFKSTDLGLESRRLSASTGYQGRYRLTFVYDELLRNRSDTYQTPYNGTDSNVLTLPSTWLVPNIASSGGGNATSARGLVKSIGGAPYLSTAAPNFGALIVPTASQAAVVDAAANADLPLFHDVGLFTKRRRLDAGAAFNVNDHWGIDLNIRPEHKDGFKPIGTVSRNTAADISAVIPDRIDTNHNQATANLSFQGAKAYGQVGYYGSFFRNNVPFMSWQNWATVGGTVNTMSSTPDNNFSQLNGSMGVNLSPKTKLVGSASYGRMTQNDAFLTDTTAPVVPVRSLNGLVVNTMLSARLTSRPANGLTLAASYKFNDRDNRTSINIYQFADAGEQPLPNADFVAGPNNPLGAVVAQNANANRPYSRRSNLATFDADYRIAKGQWVKGGYDYEQINRRCNDAWISCADAAVTREHTARAEWRATSGLLTTRVIYAYSARRADYNENAFLALVPYAGVSPASATGGATSVSFMQDNNWNGYGPALGFATTTGNMNIFFPSNNALANGRYANGNRISELAGMRRYYVADRNRQVVRGRINWQATDALSVGAGVDVNDDNYLNSVYGLQSAKGAAINLDGGYALAGNISFDVFYTYQHQRSVTRGNTYTANSNASPPQTGQPGVVGLSGNSCDGYTTFQQRNINNKIDPCTDWSADMPERVHTAGFGLAKTMRALSLNGMFLVSQSHWDNTVSGGNWANNLLNGLGAPPTTVAAWYIAATALPTSVTTNSEVRVGGAFAVRPNQSIRLAYDYLRMTSSDWTYEGMQIGTGTLSGVLPSNEQPFSYKVHAVSVSYVVTF